MFSIHFLDDSGESFVEEFENLNEALERFQRLCWDCLSTPNKLNEEPDVTLFRGNKDIAHFSHELWKLQPEPEDQ